MAELLSCPNCGAPRSGALICEYCGTNFHPDENLIHIDLSQNFDVCCYTTTAIVDWAKRSRRITII